MGLDTGLEILQKTRHATYANQKAAYFSVFGQLRNM